MLVNVVDVPPLCNFILPAIVRTGPLAIAISTAGASPALAKRIKREIAEEYGEPYARLAVLLNEARGWAKAHPAHLPGPQGVLRVDRQRRARPGRAAARRRRARRARPDRRRAAVPTQPRDRAELTHLDEAGRARMVDVGGKAGHRAPRGGARAACAWRPRPPRAVAAGDAPKGDVLGTARIAGHPGRQAHRRADPAVPPAARCRSSTSRPRSTPRRARSRSTPRRAPPPRPASRWRR